jgi:hypothetical protein
MGMAILVAVVHIWPAVIIKILMRSFDAIVETLPLNLIQFLRRHIPAAAFLAVRGKRLRDGRG